ncbi:MAG: hypothetical protein JWM14_2701 [Chitinophagaceae bacterium]|nr:hypothetical protein [Chitinophagaceae bacterium]
MKIHTTSIQIVTAIIFSFLFVFPAVAQDKPKKSPAATVSGVIGSSTITIHYNQPSVKERKIWGGLVPYNEVWRTGANEATTFETTKDITVEGVVLPAGKYALFTIPGEQEWTIIFNKTASQWGAFKYDAKEDQLRVKVKSAKAPAFVEQLTFYVEKNKVFFRWENLEVGFSVK